MGGCISLQISCDQALNHACGCLFGDGNYINKMEVNLEALEITTQELQERRDDLLRRVSIEEDQGLQRLAQVQGWFSRVEDIGSQVNELLKAKSTETKRLCLFGFCSNKCISSCNYGKEVLKKLAEVKELLSKGVFDVVAQKIPVPKAEKTHIQTTFGLDTKVEMAWKSLMNDERRILGLYGMGGVGKTTLLNHINNKFVEVENEFNVVIWVVVSKEFQNDGIQDQILRRLRVDKEWKHETEKEKASVINNSLKRKKFVLLLDDLWSEVDLNKIGVPTPTQENGSKIVFTTRSKEVCNCMIADEQIKVDCLSPYEAWELFQITVGNIPLKRHPDIPTLARKVAEKCCGLPLALNVIGKAMACKEDIHEWRHTIDVLNSDGHEFPGMEERILPILKFSYDSLKDGVKLCFLYCSLFPEDYEIKKEELIEYWICEGFINAHRYEDGGTNQGYDIIGLLVRAHLLIDCEFKSRVKMHDVIREMALWIQSGFGKQQETICVKSGAQVRLIPKHINWEILKRMSLMRTQIEEISCSPNCPNLSTLLLPNNLLADISVGFFRFMPQLVVLDLSRNLSLWELPEEISNLGSLQYLNLSSTRVKSLPFGLQKLRKLIYLNLEFTDELKSLVGIATTLSNLQVLKLYQSDVSVDNILMEELQRLEHLKVLTANIKDAMILEKTQEVERLARSIRCLYLLDMSAPCVILNTVALGGLQQLRIMNCNISEIKIDWKSKERRELSPVEILPSANSPGFKHLSTVHISGLRGQNDLSWLLYAQNLTHLTVVWSSQIKEIINKEKGMSITKLHRDIVVPFENLEDVELYELDGLTEMCWNYPNLPNCKRFSVKLCPKLPKDIATAVVASASVGNPRHDHMKLDVYGEVLQRLQESNYEETTLPDFEDHLLLHFNRLPARYALDVKVERPQDVLTHKRLLKLAEDPATRPVFEVRSVQVSSSPRNCAVEEDAQSSNPSSGQGALEPPAFGSSPTSSTRPMHEITFATIDKPKLLSQLTSMLLELGLNIQEAHAFSTVDDFSLDIFVVDGWSQKETDGLKDALSKEILKLKDAMLYFTRKCPAVM